MDLFRPNNQRFQNICLHRVTRCGAQTQSYYRQLSSVGGSKSEMSESSMSEDGLIFSSISSTHLQEVLKSLHQTSPRSRKTMLAAFVKTSYLARSSRPQTHHGRLTKRTCRLFDTTYVSISCSKREPVADGMVSRRRLIIAVLSDDGAYIIVLQGAQCCEWDPHKGLFESYAREHGAEWIERFRDRLGQSRSTSLYLLTGFHRICWWSLASFSMQNTANTHPVGVHCTLIEVDEVLIQVDSVWNPAF